MCVCDKPYGKVLMKYQTAIMGYQSIQRYISLCTHKHTVHVHTADPPGLIHQRFAGLRVSSSSGETSPSAQLFTPAEWNEDRIWECGINVLPRPQTAGPDVYSAVSLQSCRHSTPAETRSGNNVFICSGGCEHTHKDLSIQLSTFS